MMKLETESGWAWSKHHWGTTMEYYAGIDVSLESASLCVVDATGRIVREAKVASEPETLIEWFRGLGIAVTRIGLEAGPRSEWLYAGMRDAGLAVELLETRHVRDAFKAMPVKTDRKDARGIAQLMRLGWFRPVHCTSLPAQEVRALLTARKLLQTKNHDVEMSLRGVLRGFGLKVGRTTPRTFPGRIRRRLRSYLWRQWRNGHNRFNELRRRGVPKFNAAVAAGSPTGLWRAPSSWPRAGLVGAGLVG